MFSKSKSEQTLLYDHIRDVWLSLVALFMPAFIFAHTLHVTSYREKKTVVSM